MQPETMPDYAFWSRLDTWSPRDAALLLCGLDPDRFRGSGLRLDRAEVPPAFAAAAKVYRILKSASDLGRNAAPPFAIVEHALGKGLPLPTPLLEAVRERFRREHRRTGRTLVDDLDGTGASEPYPRTRQLLLRLIYVMARSGYGFGLEQPHSDAREIAADAERLGLVLDRGAIARQLQAARELCESAVDED